MTSRRYNFRRPPAQAGFTLVELLVVISIIALMLAMMVPVYNKIIYNIIRKQVRTTLASLESGCQTYMSETCGNGSYPPGDKSGETVNLVKYLTGKGMPDPLGIPPTGTTYSPPPAGGVQMIWGGRVYGPYVELNPKSIVPVPGGYAIKDAYSNLIAYYVRQPLTSGFTGNGVPSIADPGAYCTQPPSTTPVVDMFCASPGPNGTYGTTAWADSDDIVTFISEE